MILPTMTPEEKVRQMEKMKHQLSYRHKADLDPFAPKENIFKLVDPSTRGYGLNKKSK